MLLVPSYLETHIIIIIIIIIHDISQGRARHGSSIGCTSAWYADGRVFDPQVRQHSFVKFGREIISMAILSLSLIQEGQLSVNGERLFTKVLVNCLGGLPMNGVDKLTDRTENDLKSVEGP